MSNRYKILFIAILFISLALPQPLLAGKKRTKGISGALNHPALNRGKTSIVVADIASGKEILSRNPDMALIPASCAKIITAAAALSILGPDHRFETNFYSDSPPKNGAIGTLFIAGTGDPTLVNENLETIAAELNKMGVRHITSGIVIDNSYFDSYDYPRKNTGQGRAYTAKTSALAVNFNSVEVEIGPGKKNGSTGFATVNPPSDYFHMVNKLVTARKFRADIRLVPEKNGELLIVTGRIPLHSGTQKFYRSISDPLQHAGATIRYFLEEKGIKVSGTVRAGKIPATATQLLRYESKPLSEIVSKMNKRSNNFIAEQLLKHLGAVRFGVPGSSAKGAKAAGEYMASIGIPAGSVILENGSGLSENSSISAGNLVKILIAARKNKKFGDTFFDSLSVLGVDGTTKRWRFADDLEGLSRVKTGTIDGVSSLAGYTPTADGKLAAFAIIVNDMRRGVAGAHQAQIDLLKAISEDKQ